MRLLLLPPSYNGESQLSLSGKERNYIVNVLRLKENASLTGRDLNGNIYNLTILEINKNSCVLASVRDDFAHPTTDEMPQNRPTRNIILYQCLPKGRKADEIVKRATEIGVKAIVLVKSQNCITVLDGKENTRLERYQSIIKEAIQQSGSLIPTEIAGILDISKIPLDFQSRCEALNQQGIGLVLHQCKVQEEQQSLLPTLQGFSGTVGVIIGPEGGFTQTEIENLINANFKPILLTSNILRCETASIYAISAIQTIIETTCQ